MKTRCDFCGQPMVTPLKRPACRTCVHCARDGAPDQSLGTFNQYLIDLRQYQNRAKRRRGPKPQGDGNRPSLIPEGIGRGGRRNGSGRVASVSQKSKTEVSGAA